MNEAIGMFGIAAVTFAVFGACYILAVAVVARRG